MFNLLTFVFKLFELHFEFHSLELHLRDHLLDVQAREVGLRRRGRFGARPLVLFLIHLLWRRHLKAGHSFFFSRLSLLLVASRVFGGLRSDDKLADLGIRHLLPR